MAPIRVGILGLSPGQWAANAHLPYLKSEQYKFKIVAVCNSSAESARKSIETLKLAKGTKAYGNPEDLAADKDIDLVVCTVRVDRHCKTITPAIKAGKNVLVEWPLGKNLQEAESLLELSKQYGTKIAAVGCQGRFDDTFQTVGNLLKQDRIGKVLSTTLVGPGLIGGLELGPGQEYLSQIEIGGNLVTIPFGHFMDSFTRILGEPADFTALLSIQRPTVKILNPDPSTPSREVNVTAHDHLMLHGTLKSGAIFSINIRGGKPFGTSSKPEDSVDWRIYGETGEIWVKAPNMHMQMFGGTSVRVHKFERDEVEDVGISSEPFKSMHSIPRNVARLYEAIAEGDKGAFCTFEQAVDRHRLIDEIYKQNGVQ